MSEEYRNVNENGDEKYLEAYILWARTSLDLNNTIDILYQQSQKINDINILKQMVQKAYEAKNTILDTKVASQMNAYFKDMLKVER